MEHFVQEKQISAIAGGMLLFLGHLIQLMEAAGSTGIISKTIIFTAHLLLSLGILGIYDTVAKSVGIIGRIGTLLTFFGTIFVTAVVFVEISSASGVDVRPVLDAPVSAQIGTYGPLLFVLGLLMLGATIGMTQGLANIPGWLLVIGTIVFSGGTLVSSVSPITATAGGALTGAGFVWLGLLGFK